MENPRQDLRDMLRMLRRFAESHTPADDHDRIEYWRGLQAIEVAENILVPPRNLADEYPEAKPMLRALEEAPYRGGTLGGDEQLAVLCGDDEPEDVA